MLRRCDGNDPNLIRYHAAGEDSADGTPECKPCECGKVFNDVDYMVIYPHERVGGSLMLTGRQHDSGTLASLPLPQTPPVQPDVLALHALRSGVEGTPSSS